MSEDLRRLVRILIAITAPVFAGAIAGRSHYELIVLSVPLLLCCSVSMLALLALAILGVVCAIQFTELGPSGELIFLLAAPCAMVSALRDGAFDSGTLARIARWPGTSRVMARLTIILGIGLFIAVAFDDVPWVAGVVLGLGYATLGYRLRPRREDAASRPPLHTALTNAVVAFASVVFSLAIIEVGCRLFVSLPRLPQASESVAEPNNATLWAPRRSWHGELSIVRGIDDVIAFNATHSTQGWRGPEIGPKQPNELRVALVGDSMTYGWGVDDDETIDSYLRKLVAGQPRAVTIVNMGVFGFAPWQELDLFRQRGLPLDPDVLILQLYTTNDIAESLLKQNEILGAFDVGAPAYYRYWMGQNAASERIERALRSGSSAYNAYRTVLPRWIGLNDILEEIRFISSPRELHIVSPRTERARGVEIKLKEYYPALERAYTQFESDVLAISALCKREEIEFYAYLMPSSVLSEDEWQAKFERSRTRTGESLEFDTQKDVRLVDELIRANGFRTIAVYSTIAGLPDPQALFLQRDGHLAPEGNRFVATIVFDQLVRDGFLDSTARASEPDSKLADSD